jgi:AAA+ superfamily predicted ATPase
MVLTTNRITSLDIAVQSRIHLAIRYDDLYPDQRAKIFDLFLDQLKIDSRDRADIREWIKEFGSGIKLNGRQIRNVVSSAQALARGERHGLRKDHIKRVMNITKEFQEQLESLVQEARANNEVKMRRRG